MDNEQLVLSFMELTNLPIEDAKRYLTAAGNILEVAIQNYYERQGGESAPEEQANSQQYEDEYEEEVRAPLPREYSQLIEEESVRSVQLNRVKRQFSSSFRDLKKETEIQENLARGIAPKRKCLEDIYRNPIDITANMDFYSAKYFGQKQGKWIALLINDESFLSLSFNRDIFNTDLRQRVKQLIKKNFVFLRKNSVCEESIKILQNYKLTEQSIPIFLIIDSLTGELRKNFGDTKNVTLKSVVHELKKYTSSENKDLKYSSDGIEDSDDNEYYPVPHFSASSSRISTFSSTSNYRKKSDEKSDSEESFASIDSDDVVDSDDERSKTKKESKELVKEPNAPLKEDEKPVDTLLEVEEKESQEPDEASQESKSESKESAEEPSKSETVDNAS